MGKRVRCALLGTGRQAGRLAQTLQANNFDFIALLSRDLSKGTQFLKQVGYEEVTIFSHLKEILDFKDISAVFIATPDFLHFDQALQSLQSGKHVYLEKPIALKVNEGHTLFKEATKKRLTLEIGYHLREIAPLYSLRKLMTAGNLGKIETIHIEWHYRPENITGWRNEGNPWWCASMLGTHCLDLVMWFFGWDSIVKYEGKLDNKLYGKNDDSFELNLELRSNTKAFISCSLAKHQPLKITIISDKGEFLFDHLIGETQFLKLSDQEKIEFQPLNPWCKKVNKFHDHISTSFLPTEQILSSLVNLFILENLTPPPKAQALTSLVPLYKTLLET